MRGVLVGTGGKGAEFHGNLGGGSHNVPSIVPLFVTAIKTFVVGQAIGPALFARLSIACLNDVI
jgi:hypothetical protein